jgi:threonine aldolase
MRERLVEDHVRARRLAEGIAGLPGVELDPRGVRTNIVMIPLRESIAARVAERLARDYGVLAVAMGAARIRFVTHREVDDSHVSRAIEAFAAVSTA